MEAIGGASDDTSEVVDFDQSRASGRPGTGGHDHRDRTGRERGIDVPRAVRAQALAREEHEPRLDEAAVHREAAHRRVAGQSGR